MNNNSFEWLRLDNAAKIFPGQNTRSWSNVFRVGVQLKQEIDPQKLEKALDSTLKRIPGYAVRIRKGFFWHYFEKNPNPCPIMHDIKNLCYRINFKENNGYLFRLYYHGNRISVDIYHALSDGYGGAVFLSTLVGEYLRLCGFEISHNRFVLDVNEPPKKEEIEDAYNRYASSKVKYDRKDKWVYHSVGTKLPRHRCNYVIGIMSFEQIHSISKKYGVTVTEFFAAILLDIHYRKQLREAKKQREVSVQIPVNLRKAFPSETLRNFVLCLRVKIDPNMGEYTFEEILRSVSLQLRLVNNDKFLNSMMTQNLKIERNPVMKYLPLPIKTLGVGIGFGITAEQTTSTLISNLGPVVLPPDMAKHVERFFFFNGPGKLNGARCAAISLGDELTFTFSNCYEESDIEREFFTRLVKMGVHVKIESNRD
ncbi:MAG: alcohol acetyltransferase [Clostridia bacterium]|nr:alcohol acetyltransferase [Clostridia bacterium]